MKIKANYTFSAIAKQVTFTDYNPVLLDGILLIVNVTDNIIIYNFADPTKGGTVAANVLTLAYDTTSMSDTDKLLVYYEDTAKDNTTVVSNMIPAVETGLATSANQLPDGHEVEVNNFPSEFPLPTAQVTTLTPPAAITGFATSAKQLADNHQVTVSNPVNTVAVTTVKPDGTNIMPSMDAAARAGFMYITNGTYNWSINGNGYGEVSIRGFPTSGLAVKNPLGSSLTTQLGNGVNIASIKQAGAGTTTSTYVQPVQVVGKEGNVSEIDALSRGQTVIVTAHKEIHEGHSFTAYYVNVTDSTNGYRSGLYIKTPATMPLCHLIVSFSASAAADFYICEAPTIAANTGTHNNVIINRYRDSSNASECFDNAASPAENKYTTLNETEIAGDGTWNMGTVIRTEPLVVGAGSKPAGGTTRDEQEYVLKANTAYVFLLVNATAAENTHHIFIDWYEHTNGA